MKALVIIIFIISLLIYGIAQITAAFQGIDFHFGAFWAVATIAVTLPFRFTLPITIGSFFGAMDVWQWHWTLAALFAAPGLALVVPGILVSITGILVSIIGGEKK